MDIMFPLTFSLPDEAATLALGASLARVLLLSESPGLVLTLEGDLGAGKTTLVRGVLRQLGFTGKVKSPTYPLLESYSVAGLDLHHFDFYRFKYPEEYFEAGLDEYFGGQGICFVEWPEKAAHCLALPDVRIELYANAECVECVDVALAGQMRQVRLNAESERGRLCLETLAFP